MKEIGSSDVDINDPAYRLRRFPSLSRVQREAIGRIVPSHDHGIDYYPCRAKLLDGAVEDRVVVVEAKQYITAWGVWPSDDSAKREVALERVQEFEETPYRMPPFMANRLYLVGETSMGGHQYELLFDDGRERTVESGNLIDFPWLPEGKTATAIVGFGRRRNRHDRRRGTPSPERVLAPDFAWCLFS